MVPRRECDVFDVVQNAGIVPLVVVEHILQPRLVMPGGSVDTKHQPLLAVYFQTEGVMSVGLCEQPSPLAGAETKSHVQPRIQGQWAVHLHVCRAVKKGFAQLFSID